MGILHEIIEYKRKEVEERKKLYPLELLKKRCTTHRLVFR